MSGSDLTRYFRNIGRGAPVNVHIQCFRNAGAPPSGTSIRISGPGANGNQNGGTWNNAPFPQNGNFTVSCYHNGQLCDSDSFTLSQQVTPTPSYTPTPTNTPTPSNTPTPTNTPSPTPTFTGTSCGEPCSPSAGSSACPQDHICVDGNNDNLGVCTLNVCAGNPNLCYSDGCTPIPDCGEPCDPSEGANACSVDHVCQDPENDGTGVCVLEQCADNPALCQADQCTPLNEIDVTKTAVPSCSSTGAQVTAVYTVRITNGDPVERTIDVVDNLENVDGTVSNISNGGVLNGAEINWADLTLPASGTVTLTYTVTYSSDFYNVPQQNTVVVYEENIERGRAVYTMTPFCTTGTALISDEADRILIAMGLILTGMVMYRLGLHNKIGDVLWNAGLGKVAGEGVGNIVKKDRKEDFESRALDSMSDDK
ncbi:MAG: hypothetical protein TR69_WS6001001253 [candidate division WS6 bacterium OLB20]|uniref:DUF11 domain-containing protein n=1 Tax=candidate division WS6 bacterium OLB20 TaxID=1617426 RepID=A0A136LWE3_9BACT|nr:MAG: hypothetical protein TR69_WS6001001253 [candidate division WS6 bacterium OLB20]